MRLHMRGAVPVFRVIVALALAAGLGLASRTVHASTMITLTVNTTTDDAGATGCVGTCSLRDAITVSNTYTPTDSVTIKLPASVPAYQISNGLLEAKGAAVKIAGAGPAKSVLDAGGVGTILQVDDPTAVTITGVGFTGAAAGAISTLSNLALANDAFKSNANSGGYGGAINIDAPGHNVTISGTLFDNNSATVRGGGIYIDSDPLIGPKNASVSVSSSTFSANSTSIGEGGAIDHDGGTLNVKSSLFKENHADNSYCGAICSDASNFSLNGSQLISNHADQAGALYAHGGTVTGNIFRGNTANAIAAIEVISPTLINGNVIYQNAGGEGCPVVSADAGHGASLSDITGHNAIFGNSPSNGPGTC